MCGRYTLRKPAGEIAEAFDVPEVFEIPPRYNIAPTQDVPVVRLAPDRAVRGLGLLHWGLIPSWILLAKSDRMPAVAPARRAIRSGIRWDQAGLGPCGRLPKAGRSPANARSGRPSEFANSIPHGPRTPASAAGLTRPPS